MRTPGTKALFIYMVEDWAKKESIDQRSTNYLKDPDTPVRFLGKGKKGKKGKKWVRMASVAFANSISCLRVELLKYLGDKSGDHGENNNSWPISRHTTDECSLLNEMVL